MTAADLLTDGFERIRGLGHKVVDGLDVDALAYRITAQTNSIAWLVWHLIRVQDDHIADAAGDEQSWTADGWSTRFELPFDDTATGYGQSAREVGEVRVSADLLAGYLDAVTDRTIRFVATLGDTELARIVDPDWDPPVTLAVRLVSVVSDDLQHLGQAALIRGLLAPR